MRIGGESSRNYERPSYHWPEPSAPAMRRCGYPLGRTRLARRPRRTATARVPPASRAAAATRAADASRADLWRRVVLGLACLQTVLFVLVIDPNAQDALELPKAAATHA